MNSLEVHTSFVPDWASHIELVVHEPETAPLPHTEFPVRSEHPVLFLLAVIATHEGQVPPFLDAELQLLDPSGRAIAPSRRGTSNDFVSSPLRLAILDRPKVGTWNLSAIGGVVPYSVSAMAFHPSPMLALAAGAASGGTTPRVKCRACKTTAKALAISIVAAATLASLPSALIAAVATYLGVPLAVAAAFIASVLGDTAAAIAEKLCTKVGLCP